MKASVPRLGTKASCGQEKRAAVASSPAAPQQLRVTSPCGQRQSQHAPRRWSSAASAQAQQVATNTTSSSSTTSSTFVTREARRSMFGQAREQVEPVEARVVGTIPAWLNGDLFTNGAGSYKGMVHMFDGLAMLSKVSIRQGKVTGMQRHLQTKQRRHQERTGKLKWREFVAEVPADGPLEKAAAVADNLIAIAQGGADATTDNGSVHVLPLPDGTMMAMSEPATSIYKISRDKLTTLEQVRFKDGLAGQVLTAHPKPVVGSNGKQVVNFAHEIPFGGRRVFIQDLDTLRRRQIAYFPDAYLGRPAWVHDIAAAKNYAVIVEPPILFNMPCLVLGGQSEVLFMDWVPEHKTRIHVAKLDGTWQRTFVTDPLFTFHHVNAFEDPDNPSQIHVDLSVYDGPEVLNDLSIASMTNYPGQNVSPSYLKRLTVPLNAPEGAHIPPPRHLIPGDAEQLYGAFFEFPNINQEYRSRPYRYAYSLSARRPTNMGNAIGKFDLQTGQTWLWHEPGTAPGEPAFVPAPNAQSEDDGVVICNVMGADGLSFLVVLDGRTFKELARAHMPFGMGYRLHGTFIPTSTN